ncbi:type I-D CRISPR-associated protein Cas7/Csc2 [Herpetosiphon giganteus]|uniref:type I-D CRISPR-associated protein Cas7/Csc2 n=1 Tax=Herpetosiphon giganteus TaxID=2029754 RepID=UPI0019573CA3|nr:type I-D CRISPR-associated protein Cas7/Csc2 [Herpetosiphon giganteus]MBM7846736.1 CRISPR-associated protein Csc2 [Herpetosiphon giganteus]
MSILNNYQNHLIDQYNPYPHGRFVSIFILRHVESEAMFRTEGSGEPLNREFVFAGQKEGDTQLIQRVVISKRKQVAVERRMGRELLREHQLLHTTPKANAICSLNTNNPCERCIDCMVYGYAAGGGGAQRSRVITDDAFSLHPAATIVGTRQFNALFDNSTMRNPDTGDASTSIGTDEYVKPESVFLDIETLKDVSADELRYIVGNILRSSRYGAISSRIGKTRNQLIGMAWSNCELFSNLEWVQHTYDLLRGDEHEPSFPLHTNTIRNAAQQAMQALRQRVIGQVTWLSEAERESLVAELGQIYADPEQLKTMLSRLAASYPATQKKGK